MVETLSSLCKKQTISSEGKKVETHAESSCRCGNIFKLSQPQRHLNKYSISQDALLMNKSVLLSVIGIQRKKNYF